MNKRALRAMAPSLAAAAVAIKRLAPILAALALVTACESGPVYPLYTPLEVAGSFGYAEQQLADTVYQVSYSAPIQWTRSYRRAARQRRSERLVTLAYDLALWRAAELSLAGGFPAFEVAARENDIQFDVRYDAFYDPFFYPDAFFGHGQFGHYRAIYHDRFSELAVRVSLTVRLRPAATATSFDAARTLARLRAQHPDATGPGG